MKDRDIFTSKLRLLFKVFRSEPSTDVIDAYWLACSDLTDAEFIAGTDRSLKECRFMPVPAEIVSFGKQSSAPSFVPSELPED